MNDPLIIEMLLGVIIAILGYLARKAVIILDKHSSEIEILHKRHDKTDIVISSILQENFNSLHDLPHIFKGKLRDS